MEGRDIPISPLSFFNDLNPFIPSSTRFLTLTLLIDNRATSEEEKTRIKSIEINLMAHNAREEPSCWMSDDVRVRIIHRR